MKGETSATKILGVESINKKDRYLMSLLFIKGLAKMYFRDGLTFWEAFDKIKKVIKPNI